MAKVAKYKLKSNRAAAKRFRKVKGGSGIKCRRVNRAHILTKKAQKRKRHLRTDAYMDKSDVREATRLLHGS